LFFYLRFDKLFDNNYKQKKNKRNLHFEIKMSCYTSRIRFRLLVITIAFLYIPSNQVSSIQVSFDLMQSFNQQISYTVDNKVLIKRNNLGNQNDYENSQKGKRFALGLLYLIADIVFENDKKKKNLSLDEECEYQLMLENGHDWHCSIKHQKTSNNTLIPLFCKCSYDYVCNKEEEKIYFSLEYMNKLIEKNKAKNIHRGPDYQCEFVLKKKTKKPWKCVVKKENSKPLNKNDEYFCNCIHEEVCQKERLVDFYS